jgi:hypothetical protein
VGAADAHDPLGQGHLGLDRINRIDRFGLCHVEPGRPLGRFGQRWLVRAGLHEFQLVVAGSVWGRQYVWRHPIWQDRIHWAGQRGHDLVEQLRSERSRGVGSAGGIAVG